ncbi:MAG TPA: LytTR family DNA-binding domain-containing protein [Saprospiraceae bacterium]|nr:LytTR family DNA-binding domain-containing protein [Saprospiraceae bacterium]HPI06523.1 LytTR family DNA-binding domain-containing protein [Saprospiraceae bacterium]
MHTFLIEDEPLAVKKLIRLLQEVDPAMEILGTAGSIRAAVEWLENNPAPDLIFLDIELSDGQSFEIFQRTEVKSPVIFVTSYDEYALQAFKVNSVDYLLKPVQREDLSRALTKYRELKTRFSADTPVPQLDKLLDVLRSQVEPQQQFRRRFLVKHAQRYVSVEVPEIAYFWSEGRVNFFKTLAGQRYIVEYTMDELEAALDPREWFRISRQFIVSVSSVNQIHPYFGNRLKLHLKPEEPQEAMVSREKVNDFKVWLGK